MILPKKVFLFVFSNDTSHSLQLDEEWREVERILSQANDQNKIAFNLTPEATQEDIFEKFNRFHNQIFLFHYGGHSNTNSLLLKGQAITDEHLATLLKQEKHLKLVFLNGCSNLKQVEQLFNKGIPAVIATSAPINDTRAVQLARQFYAALTAGRSIKKSFDTAAAFVNNTAKETLVEYRGLVTQSQEGRFPWGLYVQDASVLDWTINEVEPIQKKNRGKVILFSLLLLLVFSLAGWLIVDHFEGENKTTPISLTIDSLVSQEESIAQPVKIDTAKIENVNSPLSHSSTEEKQNPSVSKTGRTILNKPIIPLREVEPSQDDILTSNDTLISAYLGVSDVTIWFTKKGGVITDSNGKPSRGTSSKDGWVEFKIPKIYINKRIDYHFIRPNGEKESRPIYLKSTSLHLLN